MARNLFMTASLVAATPDAVLPTPLPSHPRLLAEESDWATIRERIDTDPASARIFSSLQKKADHFLDQPPLQRTMEGRRLLRVSRMAVERIATLAMVARITKNDQYALRAIEEMLALAAFEDWNPSHFLDTAEMSLALAIGYDWLNDKIDTGSAERIVQALITLALEPSLDPQVENRISRPSNWTQVCHSGLSAAAIAVADKDPQLAEKILRRAIETLPVVTPCYAPDGAYSQGPSYWSYGTSFHVMLVAALQRLTGKTWDLDTLPGFRPSAEYVLQMTAPTGMFFNYGDCSATRRLEIPLFWFARQFQKPEWLQWDLDHLGSFLKEYDARGNQASYRLLALALLWHTPPPEDLPLDFTPEKYWFARGVNPVAAFRSRFDDPDALFVAIKGGSPYLGHAHMDAGSFILEGDGVRWAVDLGMPDYTRLEALEVPLWERAQNGGRWDLFQTGPAGHNILRFNNGRQIVHGNGQFVRFQNGMPHPHAVLDLSSLYTDTTLSVHRGLKFLDDRAVLLQDEWLAGDAPLSVCWQMVTEAEVEFVGGNEIHLRKDGKELILQVLDPEEFFLKLTPALELLAPHEELDPTLQRIEIHTDVAPRASGLIRVLARPGSASKQDPPPLQGVLDWSGVLE